ncbi:MAG TPA: T9SS type A sorting domain-containing protein [Flavobacterium sp.]|jgi:hypothetical protein
MKTTLLLIFLVFTGFLSAQPAIMGDTMLCPNSEGTAYITTDQEFDSYQWYYKYWFTSDDFMPIPGANGPSFTYDWYTYDQALFKVVVTMDGQTFESNTIQIDSYAFLPISVGFEDVENISINPENGDVMLCEGTSFDINVFNPYNSNIQWYRNGVAISGANSMTYQVVAAGSYHVVASPEVCPEFIGTNEGLPIVVTIDTNCNLSTNPVETAAFSMYPNPAGDFVTISSDMQAIDNLSIYNISGQRIYSAAPAVSSIDLSAYPSGVYFVEVEAGGNRKTMKLIKK